MTNETSIGSHDPLRVLIADDMLPIRAYLSAVLSHEQGIQIVGMVGSGAAAVEKALATRPDVVLMDLEMETPRAGVEAIRSLSLCDPPVRCVVLTHFVDDETVFAAFDAGAIDYVLKDSSVGELLEAVRAAALDMSPIRPQVARMIRAEFRAMRTERASLVSTLNIVYRLTPTELGMLRLLAEGKTQSQIAQIRHVEPSTIRTHVGNVLRKLGEPSVHDVVVRLQHLGIFEIFSSE